ncbi:MAG TPA: GMC oxidoreductase [Chitinophagales bacterium]|nr:GMC oxidoreductase [Chitinophagales bacterium]HNJ10520.1 GMC oxidoreductase [Chitinophagales bacterium]
MSNNDLTRRKFVGLSAMATIATMGGTTFSLAGCKKDKVENVPSSEQDVVIIGSGFGGAISALRLAEHGVKALMLEMGRQYTVSKYEDVFAKSLQPDGRSSWLKKKTIVPVVNDFLQFSIYKYVGVLDRIDYDTSYTRIYRGTCLGGGSVVYGAMLPYARPELWDKYFPYINYQDMTDKWYPKVKSVLDFSTVPDELLNSKMYDYARVALDHCDKAGMTPIFLNAGVNFDVIKGELDGTEKKCCMNGDVIYGAYNGYKNSLDRNYIPAAIATGNLTVQTMSKVDYINKRSDGRYEVFVDIIDEVGEKIDRKLYIAKKVFINAGVAGTMDILLKSKYKGGLSNLSDEVGKHWGGNGNIMAMRTGLKENTGNVQGAVPVVAYGYLDSPVTPTLAEQAPLPIGIELKQLLTLAITENPERGYFEYDPNTDRAELHFDKSQMDISRRGMQAFIDKLNEANGGSLSNIYFNGNSFGDNFSYHPLGGACLGLASDYYGRLKGYEGLYCLDGSMMPGFSCCANPALTIAAIAERNMENIIAEDFS